MNEETIKDRVEDLLNKAGLSAAEVAKFIGITGGSLSAGLSRNNPKFKHLHKITEVLNSRLSTKIDIDYIKYGKKTLESNEDADAYALPIRPVLPSGPRTGRLDNRSKDQIIADQNAVIASQRETMNGIMILSLDQADEIADLKQRLEQAERSLQERESSHGTGAG